MISTRNGMIALSLLLALLLGLTGLAAAEEEQAGDGAFRTLYAEAETLLTDTENVTIQGEASFTLDGKLFKEATIQLIHQGGDDYQRVFLSTPLEDGSTRENGYTVIGFGENAFANEVYLKQNHVKWYFREPTEGILRLDSPMLEPMLRLGAVVADQLDRDFADRVTENAETGETVIRLTADDLRGLPNTAADLLWRYLSGRCYGMDWMMITPGPYGELDDYGTMTQGILATTRTLQIDRLELKLRQDENGRLTGCEGEAEVQLEGGKTPHVLGVRFALTADQFGTSTVPDPRKEDWTAEKLQDAYLYTDLKPLSPDGKEGGQGGSVFEVPDFQSELPLREIQNEEEAIAYAKEIWSMDWFTAGDLSGYEWKVIPAEEEDRYEVWGINAQDTPGHFLQTGFRKNGTVTLIRNAVSDVDLAGPKGDEFYEAEIFDTLRAKISRMLLDFAETMEPGTTTAYRNNFDDNLQAGFGFAAYEGTSFWKEKDFMTFYTEKNWESGTRTKFIVQVTPEVRVVYFNSLTDATEGGNG